MACVKSYAIVRHFASGDKQLITRGLTLSQAQCHCNNPETSSRTAESQAAKYLTATKGEWFDGYTEETDCCNCDC